MCMCVFCVYSITVCFVRISLIKVCSQGLEKASGPSIARWQYAAYYVHNNHKPAAHQYRVCDRQPPANVKLQTRVCTHYVQLLAVTCSYLHLLAVTCSYLQLRAIKVNAPVKRMPLTGKQPRACVPGGGERTCHSPGCVCVCLCVRVYNLIFAYVCCVLHCAHGQALRLCNHPRAQRRTPAAGTGTLFRSRPLGRDSSAFSKPPWLPRAALAAPGSRGYQACRLQLCVCGGGLCVVCVLCALVCQSRCTRLAGVSYSPNTRMHRTMPRA